MADYKSLFIIIAGLVLFLFALNKLSDHLKELSGDKMKKVLDRFTSNLFTGILTGLIVTILLRFLFCCNYNGYCFSECSCNDFSPGNG